MSLDQAGMPPPGVVCYLLFVISYVMPNFDFLGDMQKGTNNFPTNNK
jgi:hypothetical protein